MVIDLKRFFGFDGLSEKFRYTMDLSGMELDGVKPFCAPVKADITLTAFGGSAAMQADVEYTLEKPCDRCFEQTTHTYTPSFRHTLVREISSEEDDGELILVEDDRLDVDRLLQEDILLDMPVKFLCREDCKGLCPRCGADLNKGECGCSQREIDPRWEALRDLL